MSSHFDSVYPDILKAGLGKLQLVEARQELVALFSALEHLRRDLHAQENTAEILRIGEQYLAGLDVFAASGFWLVNPKDLAFEPRLIQPAAEFTRLQQLVNQEMKAGRFARALKEGGPVFFHAGRQRGVFHSLALSSQMVGMFCGLLRDEQAPVHEITFSLLSLLLGQIADALATLHKTAQMADQIATLSGLLPICAWCKRVRDDRGYWEQIEQFISSRSAASITHAICPDCRREMEKQVAPQMP